MASAALKAYQEKMNKTMGSLELELNAIRVGRANPHVLDRITVDYYGTPTPLGQVGNITVPEARLLVIQPWDSTLLKKIEKAIQVSDLGINPINDGKVIRLNFPELTEERRVAISKDVKKVGENTKIAIRNVRRDGMEDFKKQKKDSTITEDDFKNIEKEMQELTDSFIKDIDKRIEVKTKEVMSV